MKSNSAVAGLLTRENLEIVAQLLRHTLNLGLWRVKIMDRCPDIPELSSLGPFQVYRYKIEVVRDGLTITVFRSGVGNLTWMQFHVKNHKGPAAESHSAGFPTLYSVRDEEISLWTTGVTFANKRRTTTGLLRYPIELQFTKIEVSKER